MTEPAPVAGVPPEAAPGGPAGAVGDASPDAPVPDLRKEVVRLNRRVQRLELTLQQLEEIRDANARVLDRLRSDLDVERARSQALLLNVLPQRIVDRLNAGEERIADTHQDVAILFSDFVGFTEIAGRQPVGDLVDDLGGLFAAFDAACDRHGVEKIKTIGDAYLAAAGLALHDDASDAADHAAVAAELALDMLDAVAASGSGWSVRIGIDCGPVASGVIGTRRFAYDVWGDTVNVASRLESASASGRIHVSATVAELLADRFVLEPRGLTELKGKGPVQTFFLLARR